MKLDDLTNGQVVRYRIGRAGRNDVEWGPWKTGPLYVGRRDKDLPKKFRGRGYGYGYGDGWKAGAILTLTTMNDNCAEFGQNDWQRSSKVFNAEDWYLEIEGLE